MAFVGFKSSLEIMGVRDRRWGSPLRLSSEREYSGMKEGSRGKTYLSVRGEILRPLKDELQRRHFPRIPSSIKNQSVEIEDD